MDKFKGSVSAAEACDALALGIRASSPDTVTVCRPIADGGDGTIEVAVRAGFERVPITVTGPAGSPFTSFYARRAATAVVELAATCGLQLYSERPAPLTASSQGFGEAVHQALESGCNRLILGLGGSASTDGGAGLLRGLGVRALTSDGRDLDPGGLALAEVGLIDLSGLSARARSAEIIVASDVDNPLLGPQGAAMVFGPQKGATADDVLRLELGLTRWADVLDQATATDCRGVAGAGSAGGVGFAALAALGAEIRSGVEVLLELAGIHEDLVAADLVITGEGHLDAQTLRGKGPFGVASAARSAAVPVVAVAGRVTLEESLLRAAGFSRAYGLDSLEPDPGRSMVQAIGLLERVGARIATDWCQGASSPGSFG